MPKGAELVLNKISAAPGFQIGNVIVMAGIPQVMQAMLEYVTPQAQDRRPRCFRRPCAPTAARAISAPSSAPSPRRIADVMIGSYPFMDEERRPNTHIVMRSRDPQKLAAAKAAVEAMLERRARATCWPKKAFRLKSAVMAAIVRRHGACALRGQGPDHYVC